VSSTIGMAPGRELEGKVALVTGGARNIGRAICRSLVSGGASVMINANTSKAEADETRAMIAAAGGTAEVHVADVTDPEAVEGLVEATVKHFGRIDILVNNAAIGGQTGHKGAAGRAHVVAAKAGLAGFTKGLALDLAPMGVTVNNVVPGTIDTVRGLPGAPARPAHRTSLPPLGRRGEPEEIAAMVRMLCGPDARYLTGQTIHINGGGWLP